MTRSPFSQDPHLQGLRHNDQLLLQGISGLAFVALLIVGVWNLTDPLPPAWDEAQHLLMAQDFGTHLSRFSGDQDWWRVWSHLSQRYPPLTYWLSLVWGTGFDRSAAQLLNLGLLGVLVAGTYQLGSLLHSRAVGLLAGGLLLLYPAVQGLAHVYMLDLPLTAMVVLAYWGSFGFLIRPSWRGALGLGLALGLVLLAKWNGILFLLVPLLWIWGHKSRWGGLQKLLILLTAGLVCWPWYGPNWLFVISNGLQYGATTHYYVQCPAGSWCWWTTYLLWWPLQMSPVLCGIPVLVIWQWLQSRQPAPEQPDRPQTPSPLSDRSLLWLVLTLVGGYVLYTLIGIKDPRFTVPLLPLLALLSAAGIWQMRHSQAGVRGILTMGVLALVWSGQPITPGSSPLWHSWGSPAVAAELRQWIPMQPQGLVGVVPNTEVLSAETLTYLARLEQVPTTFFPAGQVEAVEWERALADGYVTDLADPSNWGITGPYSQRKQDLAAFLAQSEQWQPQDLVELAAVGTLQTYQRLTREQAAANIRLELLEPMAVALMQGDFDLFSRQLSAWTLLRQQSTLLDPELDQQQQVLERRLQELTVAENPDAPDQPDQIQGSLMLNYQLAILALARLDAATAQKAFDQAAILDPGNTWHAGYSALMRFLFTYDLPDWQQQMQNLLLPLTENDLLCGLSSGDPAYCQWFRQEGLL
jgi:4-amino-4-deoxy-L-arabinose transferase-like glycosyltransferase